MWTRLLLKCINCDKITNLRIQIPEKKTLPVSIFCLGCGSEIRGKLTVDFANITFGFIIERGTLITGDYESGDFFHEFSDTLATSKPSTKPHNILMPTIRMPFDDFQKIKDIKDKRKLFSNEEWEDFKDLTRAYIRFDKPIIGKIAKKIIGDLFPPSLFIYHYELDYHRNYYLSLSKLIMPWIDSDSYFDFVKWININIFNKLNRSNIDFQDYLKNTTTDELCNKIRIEVCELIIRFVDLRDYFFYANNEQKTQEDFAAIQDFTKLKNFYTDCFEFIGRTSHLIFRLQNFIERGNQNTVPLGSPRNVFSADTFSALDHGQKLDILNLSSETTLKLLYEKSFDCKLRNGINHFKAKVDPKSQIISYFPITKSPEKEYQIHYIDFLNLSLDIFNSVLKIGQLIKTATYFKSKL